MGIERSEITALWVPVAVPSCLITANFAKRPPSLDDYTLEGWGFLIQVSSGLQVRVEIIGGQFYLAKGEQ